MREDVDGADEMLDNEVSTILLEEFCDITRSETLAASFVSDGSANEIGDTGRGETMQCVEREVNGAVTDPSSDSSDTMTTPSCGEAGDGSRDDGLEHCEMDGEGTLLGNPLIDMTESCTELAGFSGGSKRILEELPMGAGEESGRAPDIFTEFCADEGTAVLASTMKSV